jgi:hypothetical protein
LRDGGIGFLELAIKSPIGVRLLQDNPTIIYRPLTHFSFSTITGYSEAGST